jgi:hypothetical protein
MAPSVIDADMDPLGTFWTQREEPSLAAQKFAQRPTSKSLPPPIPDDISLEVQLQRWAAGG